jgi:hypothetical protein
MDQSDFVNFSVRLSATERRDLDRIAAVFERRPGDALRVIIRQIIYNLDLEKSQSESAGDN